MTGPASCKLLPAPFTNMLFSEMDSIVPHGTATPAMVSTTHQGYAPFHSSPGGTEQIFPKQLRTSTHLSRKISPDKQQRNVPSRVTPIVDGAPPAVKSKSTLRGRCLVASH
jgi:hypothetical protein